MKSLTILKKLYSYYYSRLSNIEVPEDLALREIALQPWGSKSYKRHLSVSSRDELIRLLAKEAPRHAYYSSARYHNPAAPDMDAKGWISADIVFDIDADHLDYCRDKIIRISTAEGEETITPRECIQYAGFLVENLVDILTEELGFEANRIRIEFSGHRGYHVIVQLPLDDPWSKSDSQVRRELVNYIKAIDALWDNIMSKEVKVISKGRAKRRLKPLIPTLTSPGLRGRVARIAYKILLFKGEKRVAQLLKEKNLTYNYLKTVEDGDLVLTALEKAREIAGIDVDEQVTVDVKRLIRIPGSLNGKTSLPVKTMKSISELATFAPTVELSPFKDFDRLKVKYLTDTPRLEVLDEVISPAKKGEQRRLQAPIALYLASKRIVDIIEDPLEGSSY